MRLPSSSTSSSDSTLLIRFPSVFNLVFFAKARFLASSMYLRVKSIYVHLGIDTCFIMVVSYKHCRLYRQ